jgi:ABC-type cobalamin/Fe3+-siderophores transport system ATPase subunit
MRLAAIHIEKFRAFNGLSMDFTDANGNPMDAIYIAGDMGIGKTTVLDAIHRVLRGGSSWGGESVAATCVLGGRTRVFKTTAACDTDCKLAYLSQYSALVIDDKWLQSVKHEHVVAIEAMAHALGWKTWAEDCKRGRLTSGQQALMKMAVPIACAPEPLDVVLIDEPELHLHLRIQTHLMAQLRKLSPTTQFIVATNSEENLQMALSYERFIIVNDGDPRADVCGDE